MKPLVLIALALGGCATTRATPAETACVALCKQHHGCAPIKYEPCTCVTLQLKATLHPAATFGGTP